MQMDRPDALTMSSLASLAAVTVSTRISGTTVVNQDREEICGITWGHTHTDTHKHTHSVKKMDTIIYGTQIHFILKCLHFMQGNLYLVTTQQWGKKICGFSFREDFIISVSMFHINHWDWYKAASSSSLDYSAAVALVTALYLATPLLDGYRLLAVDEATSCAGCDTT